MSDFITHFNNYLSSLSIEQNIALINLFGIFIIMVTLINILFIFYSNKVIDYFNLDKRYPKLAKFINLRRTFQNYYML